MMGEKASPILWISRHRLATDGQGVTTLVGFYGCPLRCKYCLNPRCFSDDKKYTLLTPAELYSKVVTDDLYFVATGGGVTFGGGEPLLRSEFIREFRSLCGDRWRICAETCLNVPTENVRIAAEACDEFIVDVKDTDGEIYRSYTGKDNTLMLENLKLLLSLVGSERVLVRLPIIPQYNDEEKRKTSLEKLKTLGFTRFDLFDYVIK